LRKQQQVKDDLLFLQKNYISEASEYQINISAKLRQELNQAIESMSEENMSAIEEKLVKARHTLIHTIQDRIAEFRQYANRRVRLNDYH